jgi:hypothetical protein
VEYLLKAGAGKPAETDFARGRPCKHPTALLSDFVAMIGNRHVTIGTVTRATKKELL